MEPARANHGRPPRGALPVAWPCHRRPFDSKIETTGRRTAYHGPGIRAAAKESAAADWRRVAGKGDIDVS